MRYPELTLLALLGTFAVAGCDVDEGPAEEAGESLDEAGDEIEDATDDDGAQAAIEHLEDQQQEDQYQEDRYQQASVAR